jgi:hypothetical protein
MNMIDGLQRTAALSLGRDTPYPLLIICKSQNEYWRCGEEMFLARNQTLVSSPELVITLSRMSRNLKIWKLRSKCTLKPSLVWKSPPPPQQKLDFRFYLFIWTKAKQVVVGTWEQPFVDKFKFLHEFTQKNSNSSLQSYCGCSIQEK